MTFLAWFLRLKFVLSLNSREKMFRPGIIGGVVVRELVQHSDLRGWLAELFRRDELDASHHPQMAYLSVTGAGAVRGPHEHVDQTDLFCFIGPSRFNVYLWDNRKGSSTYRNRMVITAGDGEPKSILVPAGIVHAYKNVGSVEGTILNFPNRLYGGRGRKDPVDEVRHEDDPQTVFHVD